jgi:AcrR family transcriptional regulator
MTASRTQSSRRTPIATGLARQLAGELPTHRATPLDALRAASHMFASTGQLDMRTLPSQVGVSRATLYRWVGSRDALLGEVLADLGDRTIQRALNEATTTGEERIVSAVIQTMRGVYELPAMRQLLSEEPELTFRLCTSRAGPVQRRIIAKLQDALEQEVAAGRVALSLPAADIAYLLVRVGESFLYSELITGEPPDFEKAAQALQLLMR